MAHKALPACTEWQVPAPGLLPVQPSPAHRAGSLHGRSLPVLPLMPAQHTASISGLMAPMLMSPRPGQTTGAQGPSWDWAWGTASTPVDGKAGSVPETNKRCVLQVSVSGQALVFVVRCVGWSWRSRAGALTYAAFFFAQVLLAGLSSASPGSVLCRLLSVAGAL